MTKVRFLANSLLKGHQRSLEATNSLFANTSCLKRDRTLWMASLCLSHQHASTDMQHDLFWSLRDLDLSRSNHIFFKASLREKHDNALADSLSVLVQKLFVKGYFACNIYFDNVIYGGLKETDHLPNM